jgi:hypothetical protein
MASPALAPSFPQAASAAADATSKHAPSYLDPESLALQASDDIEHLRNLHCVSACIEKLVLPQHVNDTEEMPPTRSELGALMRLVNDELHRRIDAADATIQLLRSVVRTSPQTADHVVDLSSGDGPTATGPSHAAPRS